MKQVSQYLAVGVLASLVACLTVGSLVAYTTTFHIRKAHRKLEIVYPVASCDSLTQVDLTDIGGNGSVITEAQSTSRSNVTVCSVKGMLAPAVHFQVILPLQTWTQRYLQVGCGGLCGSITLDFGASDGCQVLDDGGFVLAATDMGHNSKDPDSWGEDHQKRVDFAYRAQHITSHAARKLIKIFYGQSEKYSYFNGCSDGGREALMQAQRYPGDFDGIIAGAPALIFQVQNTLYHGWQARSNMDASNQVILLSAKLPILHQAVLDECDILDGVKDGLISNPAACRFDPQTLQCPENVTNTTECLTASEVEVARKLYTGPQDPETGDFLTVGQPLYGSELQWRGVYVSDSPDQPFMSSFVPLPVLRYLAFTNAMPNFTLNDLQFTKKTLDALRPRHPLYDATNTKMKAFASTGRKLILWHGLSDPHISPAGTVSYYNALIRDMGYGQVQNFARLYLLPGMAHCSGGEGLNTLDLLTAMMAWVEEGKAPHDIMASSSGQSSSFGAPVMGNALDSEGRVSSRVNLRSTDLQKITRPIYPYPYTSQYTGQGDIYDAANWRQGPLVKYVPTRRWYGSDLFGQYNFINQEN